MPLKQNDTFLLSHDPVRKSWFSLEIMDSPVGSLPQDEDFAVRNIPALSNRVGSVPTTTVNSILQIPSYREGVTGQFGFQLYSNTQTFKWWQSWMDRVYDSGSDSFGLYSEIVGQLVVSLYAAGGGSCSEPVVTHRLKLIDCWPSDITVTGLDREDDGTPVEYTVEMQIAEVRFD